MSENEYQDLQNKMQNASIEMLKVKGRVGGSDVQVAI